MRALAIVVGLLCAGTAWGKPTVYKLDLTFHRIVHNAEPMDYSIEHKDWTQAEEVETGVQAGRLFFEPNFHLESAYSKVMSAGLYFRAGLQLTPWADFGWQHHSRHMLDRPGSTDNPHDYALWDSVFLTFHFVPGSRNGGLHP